MTGWSPGSWRSRPALQTPHYPDPEALETVRDCLGQAAPITRIGHSRRLRRQLAEVAGGRGFLLQGGDCAESFAEFGPDKVRRTVNLLSAMADTLEAGGFAPVVRLARMAGQFAKPRSRSLETLGDRALPAYRGDIVNGTAFDAASRTPDPTRMLRAHAQAKATMELVEAISAATRSSGAGPATDLFVSHEALLLDYEEALTRRDPDDGSWWSVSAHALWVGDRTRQLEGAHVEFLRGIANPVGIKCGPSLGPDELMRLAERIDPENAPGRLVLVGRFGVAQAPRCLPPLMRATRKAGLNAIWAIDPMHGNTIEAGSRKTRRLSDIIAETVTFFQVADAEGVHGGGIHLEVTGEDVTECLGAGTEESALADRYRTHCDPRLNPVQAIEIMRAAVRSLATIRRSDAA